MDEAQPDGPRVNRRGSCPDLPRPQVVRDALVGPLLPGSSKLRHLFAASTGNVGLEHLRFEPRKGLYDINDVRVPSAEDSAGAPLVGEPALYGGVFSAHFGHMLAEGMHRLWAAAVYLELRGVPIVFQLREHRDAEVASWLHELLACYGIAPDQLLFLNRPMRFTELHVPVQGRVLGGIMPIPGYTALFPIQPIALDPNQPAGLYVSRRQHMFSGSYLGESLIETLLGKAGFEILYPETVPLGVTLRKLASARQIVFCEGSAIHNLELTGRVDARIFVVGRRGGTAERFGRVLDALCPEWALFEGQRDAVCLDWDRGRSTPMRSRSCSFIDLVGLVKTLSGFFGIALPIPHEPATRRHEALDLLYFLVDPRSGATATDEQLGRLLRVVRESGDVRALMPTPRFSRTMAHAQRRG